MKVRPNEQSKTPLTHSDLHARAGTHWPGRGGESLSVGGTPTIWDLLSRVIHTVAPMILTKCPDPPSSIVEFFKVWGLGCSVGSVGFRLLELIGSEFSSLRASGLGFCAWLVFFSWWVPQTTGGALNGAVVAVGKL